MIETDLFEDCQSLIKKDLESWKSYFFKWEVFAKYEENIPESELLSVSFNRVKSVKTKKVKPSSSKKKLKRVSSLIFQKSSNNHQKKYFKRTKVSLKSNTENKIIKECSNFKPDSIVADPMNNQMEIILKSVFLNFLRVNINNLEVFAVLPQTHSNKERIDSNQLFSKCQQAISYNKLQPSDRCCFIMKQHISPSAMSSIDIHDNLSVCPVRDMYIGDFRKDLNVFDFNAKSIIDEKNLNRMELNCNCNKKQQHFLAPIPNNTTLQQAIQTNSDVKTYHPAFFDGPKYKSTDLKPFKLDFSHNCPASAFRKTNKEYVIKKAFPKMNTQNEERFKNLYLHERTNSISLSMENSNFVTPERKPSERKLKCSSENILQRKRGQPSKLFFDNEKEDSESDDQIQNLASLSHYKKKIKSQVIDNDSDSDDCESIFDRVKKS